MLRLTWRGLETESRTTLYGHAGGNPGHGQGQSYGPPRQSSTLLWGAGVSNDPGLPDPSQRAYDSLESRRVAASEWHTGSDMDYTSRLVQLEHLRALVEAYLPIQHESSDEHKRLYQEICDVYGQVMDVFEEILGKQRVDASPGPVGLPAAVYPNFFEAGFLSRRSMHSHQGQTELLKVIGKVKGLAQEEQQPSVSSTLDSSKHGGEGKNTAAQKDVLEQIDAALDLYSKHRGQSEYDDLSDLHDRVLLTEVGTVLGTTLDRLAPAGSQYRIALKGMTIQKVGALRALRRDYAAGQLVTAAPSVASGNRVFLVHGHDEALFHETALFLDRLELKSVVLREQPNQGRTIIEKFEDYADVGFAVVLLTPDDRGAPAQRVDDLQPLEIATRWIDAERPTRLTRALPCGYRQAVVEELRDGPHGHRCGRYLAENKGIIVQRLICCLDFL